MNKMIKGSVAGATGIVLLMGGFGTYALWMDSSQIGTSGVESGVLDINVVADSVTWADASPTRDDDSWDPNSDLVVPGDVIKRTQKFTIVGTGKNLAGTVTLDEATLTNNFGGHLSVGFDVQSSDVAVSETGTSNDFTFSEPFGTAELTAVVTYTFDSNTPAQVAQDATSTLNASTITITQTP